MHFYVAAIPPGSRQFVTVARLYLWFADPDSFLESARSDSRLRWDWFAESRPLWPLLVAHLFTRDDKYFDQPLLQHAIRWARTRDWLGGFISLFTLFSRMYAGQPKEHRSSTARSPALV